MGGLATAAKDAQPQAVRFEVIDFALQVGSRQRMVLEPASRKAGDEAACRGAEIDGRQRGGGASAMQQHRQAQQHDKVENLAVPRGDELFEVDEVQLAAMPADEGREQALLLARKSEHIRVLEQIGAVTVIAA